MGNGERMPIMGVDEDPIRFAPDQHSLIGGANEFVSAEGTDAAQVGNPCADLDLFTGKGGAQILDPVRTDDPSRAGICHERGATQRVEVANGSILHPLHIRHVVYVTIAVDGVVRDGEEIPKDGGGDWFRHAGKFTAHSLRSTIIVHGHWEQNAPA